MRVLATCLGILVLAGAALGQQSRRLKATDFKTSADCKQCHGQIHSQWTTSSHSQAYRDPIYQAFLKHIDQERQGKLTAFCVSCHAPLATVTRTVPAKLFRDGKPLFLADISRAIRGASEYLGTLPAVLVPLAQMQDPSGVLVIGCEKLPSTAQMNQAASVGHAFTLALDRARAEAEADLLAELRELLQAFSRDDKVKVILDRRKDDSRNSPQVTHRLRTHGAVIIRQTG